MNNISFSAHYLTGEFGLIALILVLAIVEILQKAPLFTIENAADLAKRNRQSGIIAAVGMGLVFLLVLFSGQGGTEISKTILNGSLNAGGGVYIGKLALIGAAFLTILLSYRYTVAQAIPAADYYLLLLFSLLGSMTLICAEHLLVVFLALEMMSIPIYALVALHRYKSRAGESAIKYLLLGGFSSAFLLLGISFLYGATGSLLVKDVVAKVSLIAGTNSLSLFAGAGLILFFTGLAFKISLFPFHAWTPDVYEGASTPVTAYMSVAVKLSAFAIIIRVFAGSTHFIGFDGMLSNVFTVFALLTVIYGNSVALVQKNVKRMLAYSSIAHAGYMMLALAPTSHTIGAVQAVLFYGMGYIAMNILAFGVLVYLTHKDAYCEHLEDLTGLAKRHPVAAAMMALAMFSLAGIPPAIGFAGKIQVFIQLINAEMFITTVIALLASLVALYFYLNVVVQMYMRESTTKISAELGKEGKLTTNLAIGLAAAFTLIMGLVPVTVMDWAHKWAQSLF